MTSLMDNAKNVQVNQKTDLINAYNKQEAEWFGTHASCRAPLLGFYFAREDVSAEFAKIVDATQELDRQIYFMDRGQQTPEGVYRVSANVRSNLELWNRLVLRGLFSTGN